MTQHGAENRMEKIPLDFLLISLDKYSGVSVLCCMPIMHYCFLVARGENENEGIADLLL